MQNYSLSFSIILLSALVFLNTTPTNSFVIHTPTPSKAKSVNSGAEMGIYRSNIIYSSQSALYGKKKKKASNNSPIISTNRQARRNYEVITTFDAGICLLGSEIKAIRDGKMNLRDGYVRPDNVGRGMSLYNVHIGRHTTGEFFNHEERRVRPLLLNKEETKKLRKEIELKGMTIVPLKAYFNDKNLVKVQIGLCRGKNVRDKRDAIKDREMKRDTDRMMKSFRV
mmetsp:Transcript_19101/g.28262  ORF Transcript_19101/g.28262 Transcript_19101/m.28262 type:complete len:225 (-) Transcript_19101:19-693(-)